MEVAEVTLERRVKEHSTFLNNKCMYVRYTTREPLFDNTQIVTFNFIAKWKTFFLTRYQRPLNLGSEEASLLSGEVSELHFRI